jgi:hypothetical protein
MINSGTATPRLDLLGPILQSEHMLDDYVAHRVLTPIPVTKRIGAIPSFLLTNDQVLNIKHSPKTGFVRTQSEMGQATYRCEESGVEEPLSYEDYEILGKDMAQFVVGQRLAHIVLRARESALAGAIASAAGETTFAGNLVTAGATWDNASGKPIDNVLDAKRNITLQTGGGKYAMVLGYDAYLKACKNAQILSAVRTIYGYAGDTKMGVPGEIPEEALKLAFGVDELIIAKAVVNANQEGRAASRSFIWPSTYAFVFKKGMNATNLAEVSVGRMFTYDLAGEFNALSTFGAVDAMRSLYMESYAEVQTNSEVLRARDYINMVITTPQAGSLIRSI